VFLPVSIVYEFLLLPMIEYLITDSMKNGSYENGYRRVHAVWLCHHQLIGSSCGKVAMNTVFFSSTGYSYGPESNSDIRSMTRSTVKLSTKKIRMIIRQKEERKNQSIPLPDSSHIDIVEVKLTRDLIGRNGNGGEIPLLPFIAGIQWQLYT